jgi:small subunit ribosomal protein S29
MHTVNAQLLGQLQIQHDLVLEKQTVPAGTSISDLIQVAIKEKSKVHSPIILDTVMKELETQTLSVFLLKKKSKTKNA